MKSVKWLVAQVSKNFELGLGKQWVNAIFVFHFGQEKHLSKT